LCLVGCAGGRSCGNDNEAVGDRVESPPFEILEHTADIGLMARGRTLGELFEHAALGMAEILDRTRPPSSNGKSTLEPVAVEASDVEALLVEWLNEVLFRLEASNRCLGAAAVRELNENALTGEVDLVECERGPEGSDLKATTYHQLSIRPAGSGWSATVYFDV
jgi:SHS2 domain-containing protein